MTLASLHVPGLTDAGIVTTHFSEHVDLFPTLSEAAMGIAVPLCPYGDASFDVALCTEGSSLVPMMRVSLKFNFVMFLTRSYR